MCPGQLHNVPFHDTSHPAEFHDWTARFLPPSLPPTTTYYYHLTSITLAPAQPLQPPLYSSHLTYHILHPFLVSTVSQLVMLWILAYNYSGLDKDDDVNSWIFTTTRRCSTLRGLSSGSCGGLQPSAEAFYPFGKKKRLFMLFLLFLGNFLVYSSNLSNF